MAERESSADAELRWEKLRVLQRHYHTFDILLRDVMEHLGYGTSWLQSDIGEFLENGGDYIMIQAQRGQAKTTITSAYAVYHLIHNPSARCMIVSAAGGLASDISTLIVRLFNAMPQFECMRPDRTQGDRISTENFDIHYTLKGTEKSASVASYGITGTIVGKRSDLLIADDVESPKNSATALMREQLLQLTREFTSISVGRIIYLGTPQSTDSLYNTLPGRGFRIRIWPGRYPTAEQMADYGDMLAPSIMDRMIANPALRYGGGLLGDQGQPTDPDLQDEAKLQKKERDQGAASFRLQFMLSTRLADAHRYPLKTSALLVMRCYPKALPMSFVRGVGVAYEKKYQVHSHTFVMMSPQSADEVVAPAQGIVMYIDPAGGGANADETGYAVTAFLNGNIFVLDVGGVPGGYSKDVLDSLATIAKQWEVNEVIIEKNMGYGAFAAVFTPILHAIHKCKVSDDLVTGQKEARIINTLEPVAGRGSLIINEDIVEADTASTSRYEAAKRISYSFFNQFAKITRDSGCLGHDDRVDALEGAVRYWVKYLAIDEQAAAAAAAAAARREWMKDPLGHNRYTSYGQSYSAYTVVNSRLRK